MTHSGGYTDTWEYSVDGAVVHSSLGYFNQGREDLGFGYKPSTRIKFQPKHSNWDASLMGFYFDSINVASWDSADEAATKSSYCADFNAEPAVSDPGTPWVAGKMRDGDTACWCDSYATAGYCKGEGWVAGENSADDVLVRYPTAPIAVRNGANDGVGTGGVRWGYIKGADGEYYLPYQWGLCRGDIDLSTPGGGDGDGEDSAWLTGGPDNECLHDAEGVWKSDSGMNATKCKGVKWNAANGIDVATNPVCWANEVQWDSGANPWVVGTAAVYNSEGYDCRTKCAGQSGESLNYCAADGWRENEAANTTMCSFNGSSYRMGRRLVGLAFLNGVKVGWRGCL